MTRLESVFCDLGDPSVRWLKENEKAETLHKQNCPGQSDKNSD